MRRRNPAAPKSRTEQGRDLEGFGLARGEGNRRAKQRITPDGTWSGACSSSPATVRRTSSASGAEEGRGRVWKGGGVRGGAWGVRGCARCARARLCAGAREGGECEGARVREGRRGSAAAHLPVRRQREGQAGDNEEEPAEHEGDRLENRLAEPAAERVGSHGARVSGGCGINARVQLRGVRAAAASMRA